MKYILLIVFGSAVMVSCRKIKEPELKGVENVKMGRLGLGETTVTLHIRYFNPNRFNAKIKQAEGDAWMDSSYLGHFKVDSLVPVPAKSEFLVPVNLAVDMKYLLQHSLAAFSKEDVTIRILGTAKAGRNGFYKNIPLKYEGRQNLAKLFADVEF